MDKRTIKVSPKNLRAASQAILVKLGMGNEGAHEAAKVLVATDLRGIDSHGVSMLKGYSSQFKDGILNPNPNWKIVREAPATATVDGDQALGISIGAELMELAMKKARKFGIGMVTIANCGHLGAVGHFAMLAAQQDMVGVCMTASSGGVGILPTFGAEPRLGANPIGLAAPADQEPPLLIDIASSVPIANKVQLLAETGQLVPAGWISDQKGTPIMEPSKAPSPGNFFHLPLGSTRTMGSNKGYALSLIPEALATLLAGSMPSMQRLRNGMKGSFMAYDISKFTDITEYKQGMDYMLKTLRETKPAPGNERVVYPGLLEHEIEIDRLKNGIPISFEIAQWMKDTAQGLGVEIELS
jgi:L-2-hydroxycarboxylate dehydrogenase (NAD+)